MTLHHRPGRQHQSECNRHPLFDTYMAVDWSARNGPHRATPSADAVWVGEYAPTMSVADETYHRTRKEAIRFLERRLRRYVANGSRVLLGFDFAYGYPAGLAHALGLEKGAPSWRQIWELIASSVVDSSDNRNNRFEVAAHFNRRIGTRNAGPFWGCPKHLSEPWLPATSPGFPHAYNGISLDRLRLAETRLSGVQSPWKLYGIGSVGGQTLTGIPYLLYLREKAEFRAFSRVWPFETGFSCASFTGPGPSIVYAEAWPGLVEKEVAFYSRRYPDAIRDQIQVRSLCRWMAMQDQDHQLGDWFGLPGELTGEDIRTCTDQEGWILGAR